jgi:hypothetical protein
MKERVVVFGFVFVFVIGAGFGALTALALRQVIGVVFTPVVSSIKQLSPGVVRVTNDVDEQQTPLDDRRWFETYLPVGAPVWIHGKVQARESPEQRLEIVSVEGSSLLVSTAGLRGALSVITGALGWRR